MQGPLIVASVISLLAANVLAQQADVDAVAEQPRQGIEPAEMFDLYTHCRPIYVDIILNTEATQLGVDQALVKAAVESRLRAARLYTTELEYVYLNVVIEVIKSAYSYNLELFRTLYNFIPKETNNDIKAIEELKRRGLVPPSSGLANTWTYRGFGMHAGDAAFIRNALDEALDVFLANYLRVNETACLLD